MGVMQAVTLKEAPCLYCYNVVIFVGFVNGISVINKKKESNNHSSDGKITVVLPYVLLCQSYSNIITDIWSYNSRLKSYVWNFQEIKYIENSHRVIFELTTSSLLSNLQFTSATMHGHNLNMDGHTVDPGSH